MTRGLRAAAFGAVIAWLAAPAAPTIGMQPAASQQPPRFRSGVDLIEVAVLARGEDGRLVTDLTAADLRVIENGTPQQIVAFQRVALPPRPAVAAATPAVAPVPADVSTNERAADSRVFVLLLDTLHVASGRTRSVREHATRFIERHMGPDDLVAVISPGGLPGATQDFTSDKGRLIAAVQQFAGQKLVSAVIERDQERRGTTMPAHGGKDPSDSERVSRADSLARVLEALARHLSRIEGRRKAVLLFSEGIDYDVADVMGSIGSSEVSDMATSGIQQNASEVFRSMRRAVGALMRTNASLYPVDPRGLEVPDGGLVETPLFRQGQGADVGIAGRSVGDEFRDSIRTLYHLAESTGGFAAVNRTEFGSAFDRIVEEVSDYYIVGYVSSRPAKPGEFRSIDVKVSRPGVKVVARKGYATPATAERRLVADQPNEVSMPNSPWTTVRGRSGAPAPAPAAERMPSTTRGLATGLDALLASPLPTAGLPMRIQAVAFRESRKPKVRLIVEVSGQSLAFTERGGRFEERLEIARLTVDHRARASNGESTTIDLRLPPADLARVKATGVRWLSELDLPPGRHQLRVAARAVGTGVSGMITQDIDVPQVEPSRPAMSGVTLTSLPAVLMVTRGDGWLESSLKSPPSASRTFVSGDQVTAALEVYPPEPASGAALEVVAQLEGETGASQPVFKGAVDPAAKRPRHDVTFPIDTTKIPAGRYVLRIALMEAGRSHGDRRVPLEIVPPAGR
jgi:VWFA-related protein